MNGNMYNRDESGRHVMYFYRESKLSEESEIPTIDQLRELWEENGILSQILIEDFFGVIKKNISNFLERIGLLQKKERNILK